MTAVILHVTFDCHDPERMATFWAQLTGYRRMGTTDPDVITLQAPGTRGVQKLLFYRVAGTVPVKSRLHLDLAAMDPDTEIERLLGLGATRIGRRQGGGSSWIVMLDPEGNEFCLG